MKIPIYQIDAFANQIFSGNPAAVCPLEEWLDDAQMQSIAMENNLAETAFFVAQDDGYKIRWFTPEVEVGLCGHATLASAYVLFNQLAYAEPSITFQSRSGPLVVEKDGERLLMDFPSQHCTECEIPIGLAAALNTDIEQCLINEDYLVVVKDEQTLASLQPNFYELAKLGMRGVVVTAASENYDFVNRFFAPNVGIDEDPVTGSAYTKLIPYWAKRLNKTVLQGKQISARGGEVDCEYKDQRVSIGGTAIKYLQGQIEI